VRIVADTNTVVSALLWGGAPEQVLIAAREKRITLYTSPALIAELEEIVGRKKFVPRLARAGSSASQLVGDYRALTEIVLPTHVPAVVRDPDDDQVLACALAAQADAIVSGDNDLLVLGRYQDIPIFTPAQALEVIRTAR
jgi:putative PIN family toxin of toxin-antitoxin system